MTEHEQRRLIESNEASRRQVDLLVGEVRRLQATIERFEQNQAQLMRMLGDGVLLKSTRPPKAETA